jgi:hypothetical protein
MAYKRDVFRTTRRTLPFLFLTVLLVLANGQSVPVRVNRIAPQTPPTDARKIVVHHFKQMPESRTVTINAVKNLQGDRWLRDLEIEVQNNFNKPIYHLEIDLELPDIVTTELDGIPRTLIIPLIFGKNLFMKPDERAAPTDKAIQPGEKYIFQIPEAHGKAIEARLAKRDIPVSAVKRVWLRIYEVNFGDGTGFEMGEPVFNKQSSNQMPPKQTVNASFQRDYFSSRDYKSKRLKPARSPTISPQLSCGAQFSGC